MCGLVACGRSDEDPLESNEAEDSTLIVEEVGNEEPKPKETEKVKKL